MKFSIQLSADYPDKDTVAIAFMAICLRRRRLPTG